MSTRSSIKAKSSQNAAANNVTQKKTSNDDATVIADNRAQNAAIQKKQDTMNSQPSATVQKVEESEIDGLTADQKAAYNSLKHQGKGETDITMADINATADKLTGKA